MFWILVFPGLKQRCILFRIKTLDPFDREIQIYNTNKREDGLKLLAPEREIEKQFCLGFFLFGKDTILVFLVIKIQHLEYPWSKETAFQSPCPLCSLPFKQAGINTLAFQPDNATNFLKQMAEGIASKDIAAGEGKTVPITSNSSICTVLVMFKSKWMENWRKFSSECSKSQNRALLSDATVLTCIYRTF